MYSNVTQRTELDLYPEARAVVIRLVGRLDLSDISGWLAPALDKGAAQGWSRFLIDLRMADMSAADSRQASGLVATLAALHGPRHGRYALLGSLDEGYGYCLEAGRQLREQHWNAQVATAAHEAWMWLSEGQGGIAAAVALARQAVSVWGRGLHADWHITFHRPDAYPSFMRLVAVGVLALEDQITLLEQLTLAQARTQCHLTLFDYRQACMPLDAAAIRYQRDCLTDLSQQSGLQLARRRDALLHHAGDPDMRDLLDSMTRTTPSAIQSFARIADAGDWLLGAGGHQNAMAGTAAMPGVRLALVA